MDAETLIFTPAALLLDLEGNGLRPILPTLDLVFRRRAQVVLMWPEETPDAGRWSREAMGGAPHVAAAPGRWAGEVVRVTREAGSRLTLGVGASAADLGWLAMCDRSCVVGEKLPGMRSHPGPFPLGWRSAVEEALQLVRA